jgi:pimeloyl-ACP methyl ester carboxylesterase
MPAPRFRATIGYIGLVVNKRSETGVTSIEHGFVAHNGISLHCASAGTPGDGEPPLILLHGFPDHWIGWRHQMTGHAGLVIAPDGRGVNLSDAPDEVSAYDLSALVADVLAIADHYAPGQVVDIAGHDWGGVVAWAVAQATPQRVRKLLVINAPHPFVLGRALAIDPEQRQRSAYIKALRAPGAEERLALDRFAALRGAFKEVELAGQFPPPIVDSHIAAWSRAGRLRGALNWYRAATFLNDGGVSQKPSAEIETPTLMIWGAQDTVLPPALIDAHRAFVRSLDVEIVADAGHWPHQERPQVLAERISAWFRD